MGLVREEREPTGSWQAPLARAAAVGLFLSLMFVAGNFRSGMFGPGIFDPDTYSRLLRVEHLLSSGTWYDNSTPWSDAAPGGELHWTRPLDILVSAVAIPFTWRVPLRQAIVLGGSAVPVLLGCVLVLVVAWAARPFVGWGGLVFIGFAVVSQQALARLFRFSYVDHHCLILLLVGIGWAGAVRSFSTESRRPAVIAGIAAGMGVWVTVESLLWIAVISVALVLLWIREGRSQHMATLTTLYSTAAVVATAALLIERPWGDWFADEMDRISIAHVALLAAIALSLKLGFSRWVSSSLTAVRRFWTSGALFVVPAAIVFSIFPKFLRGPIADVDPQSVPLLFEGNAEFTPFSPDQPLYMASFTGAVLPILLAVVFSLIQLRRREGGPLERLAVLTLTFVAVFLPLMFYQWRWGAYAQLAVVLPWLLGIRAAFRPGIDAGSLRRALRVPLAVTLSIAHIVLALAVFPREVLPSPQGRASAGRPGSANNARATGTQVKSGGSRSRSGAAPGGQCGYQGLSAFLSGMTGKKARAVLVMSPFFDGPQIAWDTGARVVSGPYHRNGAGIVDTVMALTGADEDAARQIIERRGVDFIVLCGGSASTRALVQKERLGLAARLVRRQGPSWLVRVTNPRGTDRRVRIWRVMQGA